MRSRRIPLAAACAAALLAVVSAPDVRAGDRPEEPQVPAVVAPTDEERTKLAEFIAQVEADPDDETHERILVELERLQHEDFHDYIRRCMKSKNPFVQTRAVRAASSHEMEEFKKQLLKLVKGKPKKKKRKGKDAAPGLAAAAIDYLARMDVPGAEKQVLEVHLKKIFLKEQSIKAGWAPEMMRASLHYLGKNKYKPAVETLVTLLPEPKPTNINSASNPPASYWEGRYKLWQASEGWVRWALKEITGQEFRTHREWKAWFKKNEKKFRK